MKLTIDIDDSSFAEYFEEADGALSFTGDAINAIFKAFAEKCVWDDAIRDYIKREIKDGLHAKIYEYKNDGVIKDIARQVVYDAMRPINTGSIIVTADTQKQITEQVKREIVLYNKPLDVKIREMMRKAVTNAVKALCDEKSVRRFIDVEKLGAYISESIFEEDNNAD